jgi:hypothetical protein
MVALVAKRGVKGHDGLPNLDNVEGFKDTFQSLVVVHEFVFVHGR